MLYDFHRQQNAKRSGSIHATYLVSGVRAKKNETAGTGNGRDGEDSFMQSSPYMSSSLPQPEDLSDEQPVHSICLTREEDLGGGCLWEEEGLPALIGSRVEDAFSKNRFYTHL